MRQDYYGKSSIIVTLARFFPLKIVAIQHGLLTYKELEKAKIYPNSRVGIEAVYNSAYVDKIGLIKPAGSLIYNLGPFLDYRASLKNKENGRALIFISSGDLGNLEDVSVIRRLNEISCATGCQFLLRLHPTERRQMRRDDLSSLLVNIEPKLKLLDRDINNVILIGFFSTLLYEASKRGFRTVWVTREKESQVLPEVSDLKNAQFVTTSDLFNLPLHPVTIEPLYPRIARMISKVFPEQA